MLSDQIQLEYKEDIDEFEVYYSCLEFKIETNEIKIVLDKKRFIELRDKINKLHDEVN